MPLTAPFSPPPCPIILVVDDTAANRDTLAELLDAQNYRLIEAADGATALRLAAASPPDLVLLDVMMPDMDGYEVCRRLRGNARLTGVPVIMITALDDEASRLAGIEAGADDFISKPFNRAELRARVQTVTRLNRYRRLVESQAALHESEIRFRTLAEHCDEAFRFVTLQPERTVYVSPALEKIWAIPAAQFLTDPRLWEKAVHHEDQPRVAAAYAAVLAGEAGRFAEEYRVVRPDGSVRWVLDSGTPICDARGIVVSVGSVARDITERKAAEDLMLRAQRLENIGMLAAGIAHDFNNALAPLVMGCPILRPHVQDPAGLRLLDTMEKSTGRSVALVRQLLSFAHGASGRRQLLQTRHILRELTELAAVTFPKSIRVRALLPDGLWPVQANATQIHQIFLNLCVNARDAMPAGGELTLTAANRSLDTDAASTLPDARAGDFLTVEVRDTGTGIASNLLTRIWEPFFTTKGDGKGTGLGLSTVRGLVHQHDGFVVVETHVDHGTAFTVYLPAATEAAGGQPPSHAPAPERGRNELILVVDDEEPVRRIVCEILTAYGYRTITACDGADAIAVFAAAPAEVRLVLTDLQMPLLGGTALVTALRRLRPSLPLIVMSGVGGNGSAAEHGFVPPFLAKPFQAETLLTVVRHTLDTAQNRVPPSAGPVANYSHPHPK